MRFSDWVLGLVLALAGGLIVWRASTFPSPVGQLYGAGFFPTLVGAGLAVIGALLVLQGLRQRQAATEFAAWVRRPTAWLRLALPVAGSIAFIVFMGSLGFLLTAMAILLAFQLCLGVRPLVAGAVAVGGSLAVWYVFGSLLRVALPYGPLEALLS